MSIKTTKRLALGVIASLVFAPLVAIAPASALTASATATVGAVRVSTTAGVQDAVPAAAFSFTMPDALAGDDMIDAGTSAVLTVTTAPSATADVTIVVNGGTLTDDVAAAPTAGVSAGGFNGDFTENVAVTGTIKVTGTATGTYAGTLVISDATNSETDAITVNWSFTTTGAPASISLSSATVDLPAVDDNGGNFVVSKSVTVSVLDAAGNVTQVGSGDSIAATIADNTNINFTNASGTSPLTISDSDLSDGTHAVVIGSESATPDSETVTFTPAGVLPSLGVAAKTLAAKTVGYGVETSVATTLTTPSATNLVKAGTAAVDESAYTVDTSVKTLVFKVAGYVPGAAYKITVDQVTDNNFTVKDDTSNTTANAADTANVTLYGVVGATGAVNVTVVMAAVTTADTIGIGGNNADSDITDASDSKVTYTAATYSVTVATPSVSPYLLANSTPVAMAGKVADTYGNPVSGAVVTVTGTVTPAGTALTATATTAADGAWSLTMPASAATTTSVSYVAAAVKTGLSVSAASAIVVNFNASGSPDTLTYTMIGDSDSAAGTALDPITTYPASLVPYTGVTGAISDELYTVSTGAFDSDGFNAQETCVLLTATSSPVAQLVFTGSAGVKFSTTCAGTETVATLKDTITIAASGSNAAYAIATKVGANTVTMKSGTTTKTATFYAYNYKTAGSAGDAVRNFTVSPTSLSLKPGQFGVLTITATDAFGNVVKSVTAGNGGTITATAAGQVLVEGPTLSKAVSAAWDANGQIMIGVIGSQTSGTGTITLKGTGVQLAAAAGAATSSTAGTNGLTAATGTSTVNVTVPAAEIVYDKPTLQVTKVDGKILLSGTAVEGEGDIIVYLKKVGTTKWVEQAATIEVAAPGDFNGLRKAPKFNVLVRVKQEGTGLFSNQVVIRK